MPCDSYIIKILRANHMKLYTRPFAIIVLLSCLTHVSHATGPKPVSRAELLSLLAGDALPENIALEVQRRGISSALDGEFRKQLQRAGADATLLAILEHSKTSSSVAEEATAEPERLARAGELIRGHKYEEAADELNEVLKASMDGAEAPFVMGELLRRQEGWMKAAAVYDHLQQISPDFPQVDTKLAFIYFKVGDHEAAIRHGRRALELEPKDAEAHKNLGLAFEAENKVDATLAEYQEALRLKPDYSNVHFDLGVLFYHQHKFEDAVTEYRKAIHRGRGLSLQPGCSSAQDGPGWRRGPGVSRSQAPGS
jgi:tetratricopeptide (TPR) repeat protein